MRPKNKRLKDLSEFAAHSNQYRADTLGSYTGTSADMDDPELVQDADDL